MSASAAAAPAKGDAAPHAPAPVCIGIVVPSRDTPSWVRDTVSALEDAGLSLVGIVESGSTGQAELRPIARAVFAGYDWLDERIFGRPDDPVMRLDLLEWLGQRGWVRPSGDAAVPDLVIRLDGRTDPPAEWPTPSLGTLAVLHHVGSESGVGTGLPPGGPELVLGEKVTITRLLATLDGRRRVIGQVTSQVDQLSVRRGSRVHLRKLPGAIVRAVDELRRPASATVESGAVDDTAVAPGLSTLTVIRGVTKSGLGFFGRLADRAFRPEHWEVAISCGSADPRPGTGSSFRTLEAREGTYWADPFPIRTSDADLVFVEEYVREAGRGRLAVVSLDGSRRGWSTVTTILDLPTHLSYPFVFQWEGGWYLLPEQAATGALELYVAERFPDVWRWHSRILESPVADATLEQIEDRWWMFAAMAVEAGAPADQLHVFHAMSPLGPWKPHLLNPIVADVRSARPAGRLQRREDGWYRVAQDGSESYGHAIRVLRIDRLDESGYRETMVDVIAPEWEPGLRGTHTINIHDGLIAIDVRRARSRISSDMRKRLPVYFASR